MGGAAACSSNVNVVANLQLAVPILIVSMLGWLAYVIGFAAFNNREN